MKAKMKDLGKFSHNGIDVTKYPKGEIVEGKLADYFIRTGKAELQKEEVIKPKEKKIIEPSVIKEQKPKKSTKKKDK